MCSTGADRRPVLAGSAGFSRSVMNHQIASSTIITMRTIAQVGKPPLEVVAADWALLAADSALRAAELAAEVAVVAALDATDAAPDAAVATPPRLASSPEAPSALESSPGSAAAIAPFWLLSSERIAEGSDQFEGSCWPIVPTAA